MSAQSPTQHSSMHSSAHPATQQPGAASAGWASSLDLRYTAALGRCSGHAQHRGAVRVLAALYPEGPGVCHHVLVHPPGGLVGGDRIDIDLSVQAQAHALVTTPGATRFYRSLGQSAEQKVQAHVRAGGRLEWLPLETLAFDACLAENRAVFTLEPGAEMMGWDLLALGLPAAGKPFRQGHIVQHLELPGVWLERGRMAAADKALLQSPGGLDRHAAMGTLFFAAGSPIDATRRDLLLDAARLIAQAQASTFAQNRQSASPRSQLTFVPPRPVHAGLEPRDAAPHGPIPSGTSGKPDADPTGFGALSCGATSPHAQVVVVRVVGHRIEPIAALLRAVWSAWRPIAWALPPCPPRVWAT